MNLRSMLVRPRNSRLASVWLGLAASFALPSSLTLADEPIVFNRDIRPILSDNCFYCHGPDKNHRQADLRLDTQEGLHGSAGQSGVVVAGKPEASSLLERIQSTDADQIMPPPDSGKTLTPEQIGLVKRWIAEGGKFEGHWSFEPRRVAGDAPVGASDDAVMTQRIDAWIERGLQQAKLPIAPQADKITLLRRVTRDLIGLPPTMEEVRTFVEDTSPNAYERAVDRLLASPHFGERMAMWWLDLVRYADTVGYHGDQDMSVSPFRDYVIASFNANKPFDQFTVEQLAGDLLPNPTREQRIASGYNRIGMMSAEGGVQDKEYLAKYMAERVRNATGTWMGITLGCAECHNHKFDPLTARDFYRFGAFFADIEERGLYSGANSDGNWGPSLRVPTPEQETQLAQSNEQLRLTREQYQQTTPELLQAFAAWTKSQAGWTTLTPDSIVSLEGVSLKRLDDGSILASGKNPATDTYLFSLRSLPKKVTAFRIEVLPDDSLPRKGPGRAGNGNFVLSEFVVHHRKANGDTEQIPLQNATASYEQTGAADKNPYGKWAVAAAIDGDAKGRNWGWAVMEQVGAPNFAIFETAADVSLAEGESLTIGLWQNLDNPQHTLGRFRLSVTTAPRPVTAKEQLPANLASILEVPAEKRTDDQRNQLLSHFRTIAPSLEAQRSRIAQLEKQIQDLQSSMTSTLTTRTVAPRMIRVLARGNWMDESGEVVEPAFPESIAKVMQSKNYVAASAATETAARLTRLDLAQWMVHPDHPLTARVLSNRLWKLLFGAGLSKKLDDLGAQGDWPSHPELLDELAERMVATRWDIKRWIKTVVMSRTYQQSSTPSALAIETDPYNRHLSHQGRFRIDAEMVRDNALAISGLLVPKIGGKSVKPYQPAGYWAYLNFPTREWQNGAGEELYRRGLYTHWQRQYLHPSLLVFDAPSREECTADRARSNTPLQSLALLNDPTFVEAARAFAEWILRSGAEDRQRLEVAFQRALSRSMGSDEAEVLLPVLNAQRAEYRQSPQSAQALLKTGAKPMPTDLDPVELAAWTAVARVILNLHETITRY
ncbi:MAG: DUF1553 domain-containing protein [Pirellula sp.]